MQESEVAKELARLREQLASEHKDNTNVLAKTVQALDLVQARLANIEKAFPGGDYDGHMRYHEALVKKEEQRQKIRQEILMHLAKAFTLTAALGIIGVFWKVFKQEILLWLKIAG